ncbi:MAG: helix-turn-helix domain-containing protein [Saccharofermentanales bacterium]
MKKDGLKDKNRTVFPTESFVPYLEHPLIHALLPMDVGFLSTAEYHCRERKAGADQYILLYCTDGTGYIDIGRDRYTIRKKQIFFIPGNTDHSCHADKTDPWSVFWIHFKGDATPYFPLDDKRVIDFGSFKSDDHLLCLFLLMISVFEKNLRLGNFIYTSHILLMMLAEIFFLEKDIEDSRQSLYIAGVVRFMYENLDKDLTLDDFAEKTNLSKSYLNNIFNRYVRRSPIGFFIHLKMQQACRYLQMSNMRIYEVSSRLGYTDQYYFSRIFKKVIGVSPREFRNANIPAR